MILEKAQQLSDLLEHKKNLRKSVDQLKGFKSRKLQLEGFINKLQPLIDTCQVLQNNGVGNAGFGNKAQQLVQIIEDIRLKYQANPNFIYEAKSLEKLKVSIDCFYIQLNGQTQEIWLMYTVKVIPPTNNELLDVLKRIPAFQHAVRNVRELAQEIEKYKTSPPKTQKQFDDFIIKVEELRHTWGQLGSEDIPEEVLTFLRSAVLNGASLELLTDRVKDWLNKNGIVSSFRIKLS